MNLLRWLPALVLSWLALGCATPGVQAPVPEAVSAPTQASAPLATRPPNTSTGLSPLRRSAVQADAVAHIELPSDIWERIRRGFAMTDLQSPLVQDREQWYAQRPDYMVRMTERSRKYMYHIVEELEQRRMPTELALLPFVESAFNPQAVSVAKATGMWQFMPATGRDFDLKQNAFRDDRRDILASTRAALDYLQKLYGLFGDWHLALASYNWGEGSVGRAIARNQKAGLPTDYTELSMPMETRFYVPKFQAIKNIIARPDQFGVKLPDIPNHPYFQSVPLPRDMDVTVVAKLAEVSVEDFRALNPSAHRPVLLAAGTPQILLPWDNAEVFQRNYETFGGGRLASWTAWVAPSTMKVAEAARRVGMSETEFRTLNNIPPRMLVKVGSVLLVPRKGPDEQDVTTSIADHGQLSLAAESMAKSSTKPTANGKAKAKGKADAKTIQTAKATTPAAQGKSPTKLASK
ncbi:MAG: transglycosylase SLT domain-containing protein [Alphaproteobacteria bacterium]|nr:transglycosylase SLT domain-containing protein [Alphaproteobacteria bacterium]